MDVEHEYLAALVDEADYTHVINHGITEDWFADEQHRRVFILIRNHHIKWGEMPSRASIKSNYPGYRLHRPVDPIDYLTNELRNQFLHASITDSLIDVQDALQEADPVAALRFLQEAVGRISTDASVLKDNMLTQEWEERLDQYREYRDTIDGGLRGLPTGFVSLDKATMGLQPEQLITLVGLPKSGKSTLALIIAIAVQSYLNENDRTSDKVLVISFEMSNSEQAARYDAFTAHISHHALLSGGLTEKMENALLESSRSREGGSEMILAADPSGMTTLSGIEAKIREHKPVLVIVDGAYLLDDENGEPKGSSQALTNITRGMKRMAQRYKIPIVVTTQALSSRVGKRSGVQLDSIGYTSSFAQDSDLVVAAQASEEDSDQQILRVVASRIGPKVETVVVWNWELGIFEELSDDYDAPAKETVTSEGISAPPSASKGDKVAVPRSLKRPPKREAS